MTPTAVSRFLRLVYSRLGYIIIAVGVATYIAVALGLVDVRPGS